MWYYNFLLLQYTVNNHELRFYLLPVASFSYKKLWSKLPNSFNVSDKRKIYTRVSEQIIDMYNNNHTSKLNKLWKTFIPSTAYKCWFFIKISSLFWSPIFEFILQCHPTSLITSGFFFPPQTTKGTDRLAAIRVDFIRPGWSAINRRQRIIKAGFFCF